ncbi:hypothetical protein [Humibacter ginsenosidimutans]|uniref:DUF1579 domain-containing protein n=1 Tax=Humibacter ginsenosidimutans TaxID=2599293 RepID=A0A5B8M4W9_9MICO|nr:hypothetical protein [Humibacter ginsenosidimutans]QDZ15396.1 hypothetical protein FPZ11_12065 [Humibacter ginsenosidimutans]
MTDLPSFAAALVSEGVAPEHPNRMTRFGQLVGTWRVSGERLDEATGEWTARDFTWIVSWVMEGRAVEDLEVIEVDGQASTVAVAVRVYDPAAGVVRVSYFAPAANQFANLVAQGWRDGLRQDGTQNDERPIRWNFSEITDESYVFDGWVSDDDGATWKLVEHLEGTRLG